MDRIVVLTGGSRGVGGCLWTVLAREGFFVRNFSRASGYDLIDPDGIEAFVRSLPLGSVSHLVLNAAMLDTPDFFATPPTHYRRLLEVFQVNVLGQLVLLREIVRMGKAQPDMRILYILSTDLETLPETYPIYTATKAAMQWASLTILPRQSYRLTLGFTNTQMINPDLPVPPGMVEPEEVAEFLLRAFFLEESPCQNLRFPS